MVIDCDVTSDKIQIPIRVLKLFGKHCNPDKIKKYVKLAIFR